MRNWEEVKYSRKQIERAGQVLASGDRDSDKGRFAIQIVDNWRAAHAYPLDSITQYLTQKYEEKLGYTVVQRLKRLDSIIGKLERYPTTDLFRMQDLGGCRIIVPKVTDVFQVLDDIEKDIALSELPHEIERTCDYIGKPKLDGYRSLHVILRFKDNCVSKYNGMRVELQIRTEAEHLWATAVEIIDAQVQSNLKNGKGDPRFSRFFALASWLFAMEEHTSLVPEIPCDMEGVVRELQRLDYDNSILEKLGAFNAAIRLSGNYPPEAAYYLLIIDFKRHQLKPRPYRADEIEKAIEAYKLIEANKNKPVVDVVLVSADSFQSIRSGYPNYFSDTLGFAKKIDDICSAYPEASRFEIKAIGIGEELRELFDIDYYAAHKEQRECCDRLGYVDGIGGSEGNLILGLNEPGRLRDSYLRYSAIIHDTVTDYTASQLGFLHFKEPAIIIVKSGGSYLVDQKDWYLFALSDVAIVRCKCGTTHDMLLTTLAWIKTDIFTWNMFWNKNSRSAYEILESIRVPALTIKQQENVLQTLRSIISVEYDFANRIKRNRLDNIDTGSKHDDGAEQDLIARFNSGIIPSLEILENVYSEHFDMSASLIEGVTVELLRKGVFANRRYPLFRKNRNDS